IYHGTVVNGPLDNWYDRTPRTSNLTRRVAARLSRTTLGSERGAVLPAAPGQVPVAVAVGERHLLARAGVLDHVARDALVVEPGGVVGAHAGAAVADVGVALRCDRPRCGVHELARVGDAHGVLNVVEVVAVGAVGVDADRLGVHPLVPDLLDDLLDPGAGRELWLLPCRDRDRAHQPAVAEDLHLVGLDPRDEGL